MGRSKSIPAVLYDERQAERAAHILGPSSAAAMALADLKRRRVAGESACLFWTGYSFVVGPDPSAPPDGSMTSEGVG